MDTARSHPVDRLQAWGVGRVLVGVALLGVMVLVATAALAAGVTEDDKLTASDAAASDLFGFSVSVYGSTVVVGASLDDDGGDISGSVYVFDCAGLPCAQVSKLTASDAAAGDRFGRSVAVHGSTVVVGAYLDDDGGADSGSAYVFDCAGLPCTQVSKLTASDAAADDLFGFSVAVYGSTAVVGSFLDDDGGTDAGSAYVFDLAACGPACTEVAKLTASDSAADDRLGVSVAVYGSTAVVGARLDDDGGADSGSAYVFDLFGCGAACTQVTKLTASDAAANDHFGESVAMSGTTAIVGASGDDHGGGTDPGSAYLFVIEDVTAPTWPDMTISSREVFETSFELNWAPAVDADGIASYTVTDGATVLATTSQTGVVVSGLSAATTYSILVTAVDPSGNATPGPTLDVTTAPDFADTNGHIFEDDIAWMAARGITLGCTDTDFCPNDGLTRAQMASLLARALDLPAVGGNRFDDVSGVHVANINAVAEAGITLGCTKDGMSFCPNDAVTRGQMASFMARAFALDPSGADAFTDDDGSVHEPNIDAIALVGITLGCDPGLFCPLDGVTRGQVAAFLHRAFVNLSLD